MFRNIGAGLAGVVTAFVLVMVVEKVGHLIYPPPANLDYTDVEAVERPRSGGPTGETTGSGTV